MKFHNEKYDRALFYQNGIDFLFGLVIEGFQRAVDSWHRRFILCPEFTVPKLGDDVVFQHDAKLVDDISPV